jgi:hypothetical protein
MGTYFVMESASCSPTAILSLTDSLSFATTMGYLVASQVYGSKQPGSAPLSWIWGSTPASRWRRAERAKPKRERQRPTPEGYSRLEKLPCELIDTFDPKVIRESIEWLRDWLLTQEDRHVVILWTDNGLKRPFDRRKCAEEVFAELAPAYEFAGKCLARGERVLCRVSV